MLYRFILILFEDSRLLPVGGTGNFKSNRYNLKFPGENSEHDRCKSDGRKEQ